ncbi:hypothetical protein [Nonomuraea rhizosphaerae]|uniref:hypothetical protein n=1 Tax=Nonomuraea rhizosphaerae TaxID=2665663 RepID=UPI001C606AA0|nr:hypothetical protein [Nonomuraea rhizosphaerae]
MNRKIIIAAGLLALAAAGCGSAPSSAGVASVTTSSAAPASSASASPTAGVDREEQGRQFAACMRKNGVDMPDPDPDGGGAAFKALAGADENKVREALEACRSLAPVRDAKELTPEDQDRMRQFTACMRENGVDMPDPDFSGKGDKNLARGFSDDDPDFKKAFETCRAKFPQMGQAK